MTSILGHVKLKQMFPTQISVVDHLRYNVKLGDNHIQNFRLQDILYCYFMPACSIVKTITLRCHGRPDALLHEAFGLVQ